MLTILGYYLYYSLTDGGLELPKTTATGIVGAYGGLVYLSTVLGGWIADRLLGMERTVFYGGVVVMCGHIALASMPGLAGVAVGLVLVALGSGALKANASSLLGSTPKRLAKPIEVAKQGAVGGPALRLFYRCHAGHRRGIVGKGGAASFAGVSCSTAHFGSPRLPRCPAPGEPGPSRAGSVTRTGGRPKGCEWAPYSAYP
jgi:hypothetical protein